MTTVTAFQATDGTLFVDEAKRDAYNASLKFEGPVSKFIAFAGLKGKAKGYIGNAIKEFLVWNEAGQPEKKPEPAPAAAEPAAA